MLVQLCVAVCFSANAQNERTGLPFDLDYAMSEQQTLDQLRALDMYRIDGKPGELTYVIEDQDTATKNGLFIVFEENKLVEISSMKTDMDKALHDRYMKEMTEVGRQWQMLGCELLVKNESNHFYLYRDMRSYMTISGSPVPNVNDKYSTSVSFEEKSYFEKRHPQAPAESQISQDSEILENSASTRKLSGANDTKASNQASEHWQSHVLAPLEPSDTILNDITSTSEHTSSSLPTPTAVARTPLRTPEQKITSVPRQQKATDSMRSVSSYSTVTYTHNSNDEILATILLVLSLPGFALSLAIPTFFSLLIISALFRFDLTNTVFCRTITDTKLWDWYTENVWINPVVCLSAMFFFFLRHTLLSN